jgi:hypothetical protein
MIVRGRSILAVVGALSALACATHPRGPGNPRQGGYSVTLVDVDPPEGAVLRAGARGVFAATVRYKLSAADAGRIVMVLQDQSGRNLKGNEAQASVAVAKGEGTATIRDSVTIPVGSRRMTLFIPLIPDGFSRTSGEVVVHYRIE